MLVPYIYDGDASRSLPTHRGAGCRFVSSPSVHAINHILRPLSVMRFRQMECRVGSANIGPSSFSPLDTPYSSQPTALPRHRLNASVHQLRALSAARSSVSLDILDPARERGWRAIRRSSILRSHQPSGLVTRPLPNAQSIPL